MRMALELALNNPVYASEDLNLSHHIGYSVRPANFKSGKLALPCRYESIACKFAEHFLLIAREPTLQVFVELISFTMSIILVSASRFINGYRSLQVNEGNTKYPSVRSTEKTKHNVQQLWTWNTFRPLAAKVILSRP